MKNIAIYDKYVALSRKLFKIIIVTMECEQETVPKLSNGTIFYDLE